ncbi:response regulator [endosymbiont of Lamellibrachia barhami]|uniref:response regulator n=1 Tax=endosymbiont of Lamellibrachia barhami TaxID=205975 RepID=UPI0015B2D639|nr:response regulator [endosymbiont of Lamellibrachia barhami]
MNQLELSDLSVILVEPSLTQRHIIDGYLSDLGISKIEILESGEAALEAMRRTPPDLVISTLYLPDMTGTDLVITMRNEPLLVDTAYILISSETRFRFLDPIRQAGAIAILPKPFSEDDLKIALKSTVDYIETPEIHLDNIDTESLRILVVDDSQMARNHIRRLLEAMGMEQITEAKNGSEGAQLVNDHYFDLVITDYNMPEMNGQEFIDYIRNNSLQPTMPILMITSESNQSRLAAVQQSGVSAICDKPFEPIILKRYLEKTLADDIN